MHKYCYFCFCDWVLSDLPASPLKGGSIGGPLQSPFRKVGAKASSARNYERDYAGEPKRLRSRRRVGSGGSSSCTHHCIPTRRAFGFPNVRRDRAKRVFKQTCALGCNTLGVWLPHNCMSFHKHMHHLCHHAICHWNMHMQHSHILSVHTFLLMNGSSAKCECNINFSYLETWQHGRNVAS